MCASVRDALSGLFIVWLAALSFLVGLCVWRQAGGWSGGRLGVEFFLVGVCVEQTWRKARGRLDWWLCALVFSGPVCVEAGRRKARGWLDRMAVRARVLVGRRVCVEAVDGKRAVGSIGWLCVLAF